MEMCNIEYSLKTSSLPPIYLSGAFRKGKSFLLDFILRYLINEGEKFNLKVRLGVIVPYKVETIYGKLKRKT